MSHAEVALICGTKGSGLRLVAAMDRWRRSRLDGDVPGRIVLPGIDAPDPAAGGSDHANVSHLGTREALGALYADPPGTREAETIEALQPPRYLFARRRRRAARIGRAALSRVIGRIPGADARARDHRLAEGFEMSIHPCASEDEVPAAAQGADCVVLSWPGLMRWEGRPPGDRLDFAALLDACAAATGPRGAGRLVVAVDGGLAGCRCGLPLEEAARRARLEQRRLHAEILDGIGEVDLRVVSHDSIGFATRSGGASGAEVAALVLPRGRKDDGTAGLRRISTLFDREYLELGDFDEDLRPRWRPWRSGMVFEAVMRPRAEWRELGALLGPVGWTGRGS
jgi:hypothetical protein